MMKIFKISSLNNFQICSAELLAVVSMLYSMFYLENLLHRIGASRMAQG